MTNAAHNQTKRIEAYSIAEFVQQVQQAIREGYELDLNTNENYPQQFGTLFTCGVVPIQFGSTFINKEGQTVLVGECGGPELNLDSNPTPVKRGRKPNI